MKIPLETLKEKIAGKRELLRSWEMPEHNQIDPAYTEELRRKVIALEKNYKNRSHKRIWLHNPS